MHLPDRAAIDPLLEPIPLPELAHVTYDPPTQTCDDIAAATAAAVGTIVGEPPRDTRIAVGVGSRGIHEIATITETVIDRLRAKHLDPVIVPAMGSHGGATAAGQRGVLRDLGITEERMGCKIDDRMETSVIGSASVGNRSFDVHLATAALEADAILPINRIKPHTGFSGRIESGVCKMLVVGLGKQPGARTIHRYAGSLGFEPVIAASLAVIKESVDVTGGIGIAENFYDRTACVEGLPADALLDREAELLRQARDYLATLPFEHIDLLVIDEMGKDISGTGMDTNVVGRTDRLLEPSRDAPDIARIYVRALTDSSHGNANGVGLADVIHRDMVPDIDLGASYANVLTSGSLGNAAIPIAMPDDEGAIQAALGSLGVIDPEALKIVWIRQTGSLSEFRVSTQLLETVDTPGLTETERGRLTFDRGRMIFEPLDT